MSSFPTAQYYEWITSMALAVLIGAYFSLRSSHKKHLELAEPLRRLLEARQRMSKQKDNQILALTRENKALQMQVLDLDRTRGEQEHVIVSLASENGDLQKALLDLGNRNLELETRATEVTLSLTSQGDDLQKEMLELRRRNEELETRVRESQAEIATQRVEREKRDQGKTRRTQAYLAWIQQRERQCDMVEGKARKDREELKSRYTDKILELEDKLSEYHRLRILDCPLCSGTVHSSGPVAVIAEQPSYSPRPYYSAPQMSLWERFPCEPVTCVSDVVSDDGDPAWVDVEEGDVTHVRAHS